MDDIRDLGEDIESFTKKVDNINTQEEVYRNKDIIEDCENMLQSLNSRLEECESEASYASNKKPLINKIEQFRRELEIASNRLKEKKNRWQNAYNIELLKEGKLTGVEKIQTEREMIKDAHQETDYQGEIVNSIASNIKGANRNLEGINTELKNQGEVMNRIHDHTGNATNSVKKTDVLMGKMERRNKCMKILGFIGIVVVGLADVSLLIYGLYKKFGPKK